MNLSSCVSYLLQHIIIDFIRKLQLATLFFKISLQIWKFLTMKTMIMFSLPLHHNLQHNH